MNLSQRFWEEIGKMSFKKTDRNMKTTYTKKTAILLFRNKGHYMHFARLLFRAFSEVSEVTFILTEAVAASEEFQAEFGKDLDKISLLKTERNEVQTLLSYAVKGDFNTIFSNALDSFWLKILPKLLILKIFGCLKANIGGILVSTGFAYPENNNFSFKGVRCFLLKYFVPLAFHKFFLIDEIAYQTLFPKGNKVCCLLNDPVEDFSECSKFDLRKKYNWDPEKKILLAIGVMIPEKRMDLLVKAFLDSNIQSDRLLILAGKFDKSLYEELQKMIQESPYGKQIILINRWLKNEEVNEMIAAADYISVAYANHFSNASILFRSIKAGKFALVSHNGWIGRYAKKYKCGVSVNIFSEESYRDGINKLFCHTGNLQTDWNANEHSESSFLDVIQKSYSK